jgi:hypothetical protein
MDRVFQPGFFQEHRDLVAVRRGPVVELDHLRSPCAPGAKAVPA